jgi:DNA-binding winged helix-turn-helix (wHTH) protein
VKVQFDEWTFEDETRQLRRGDRDVHLTTKAFELLKLLIAARPRVLSKNDLQEALWPGVFVSETNLFTLVSEVRAAIEDDARHPRFVRTVHGVGYAFCGAALDVNSPVTSERRPPTVWLLVWENRQFPLEYGEHIIGRDPDLTVTLESTTVSRRHARLHVSPDAVKIEDLGSKNGTFLNDAAVVGETVASDGDRIRVGSLVTTLRSHPVAASTVTHRSDPDGPRES